MSFLIPIFTLIVWTIGGALAFWFCAFINEALAPALGGFSFVIAAILFIVILVFFAGILPDIGSSNCGRPGFMGDLIC